MARTIINNEIILLRPLVRQARICVINKLVREAKKLRIKQANEKQLRKNKNKANKFLREVLALKRIKDDDISKFGIVNFENLQRMLQDTCSDDNTRAIIKVALYKSLNSSIAEFRKKFPNWNQYISYVQKSWQQNKTTTNIKNSKIKQLKQTYVNANNIQECTFEKVEENKMNNDVNIDTAYEKNITINEIDCKSKRAVYAIALQKDSRDDLNIEDMHKIKEQVPRGQTSKADIKIINHKSKKRVQNIVLHKNSRDSINTEDMYKVNDQVSHVQIFKTDTKIINNHVTAKRFTEVLKEIELMEQNKRCKKTKNEHIIKEELQLKKKTDNFFLDRSNIDFSQKNNKLTQAINANNGFNTKAIKLSTKGSSGMQNFWLSNIYSKGIVYNQHDKSKIDKCIVPNRDDGNDNIKSAESINFETDKSLHPSWTAKRKQREIIKQAFFHQGKKIKFNVE